MNCLGVGRQTEMYSLNVLGLGTMAVHTQFYYKGGNRIVCVLLVYQCEFIIECALLFL